MGAQVRAWPASAMPGAQLSLADTALVERVQFPMLRDGLAFECL
jgi:hypothetical protein